MKALIEKTDSGWSLQINNGEVKELATLMNCYTEICDASETPAQIEFHKKLKQLFPDGPQTQEEMNHLAQLIRENETILRR